jgi:hypothetical protein
VQSDLLCQTELASRSNAAIDFHRGKILLTNQNSKGTYVKADGGENNFLRRQELMLWGGGFISLGAEVSEQEEGQLMRYVCE